MGRRTEQEDDKWIGVGDARKRKQIQDRLAQRARRERIAQRKAGTRSIAKSGSILAARKSEDTGRELLPPGRTPSDAQFCSCLRSGTAKAPTGFAISLDNALLPLPNHTVYSALFHNGVILGLTCGTGSVAKSPAAPPHVPEPLRPTQYQMDNVHFLWIDRFPFQKMRERMILLSDTLNSEDFLADLFNTTTFTITAGAASWDPEAWHKIVKIDANTGHENTKPVAPRSSVWHNGREYVGLQDHIKPGDVFSGVSKTNVRSQDLRVADHYVNHQDRYFSGVNNANFLLGRGDGDV
ncbi:uncharacterized protein LY89DRAFT_732019 [Mollisia scopiformis]|uniref:Uncharacterized protein n=1 Tax=Mollisia scopiformis TaxID=149040 RepID=A0A194XFB8_MOLSC|nr:uncharacterized protein LY89DRAFT_732019 [Mollisia scopiformis]KUJ18462.1 hypothetical protein LY89DRAFT_732019 [Mollisia scopiformis]